METLFENDSFWRQSSCLCSLLSKCLLGWNSQIKSKLNEVNWRVNGEQKNWHLLVWKSAVQYRTQYSPSTLLVNLSFMSEREIRKEQDWVIVHSTYFLSKICHPLILVITWLSALLKGNDASWVAFPLFLLPLFPDMHLFPMKPMRKQIHEWSGGWHYLS